MRLRGFASLSLSLSLSSGFLAAPLSAGAGCVTENRLLDGGFEGSTGDPIDSPHWIESSTNFVSPLCRIEYCGIGLGGHLNFASTPLAWFGGALAPEIATLSQIVALPEGAGVELSFTLLHGDGTLPLSDSLAVRFDAVTLATFSEVLEPELSPTVHRHSLDGFADGGAHTLRFEYVGPTSGAGSFYVDYVRIDVMACPPSIFSDGFESGPSGA